VKLLLSIALAAPAFAASGLAAPAAPPKASPPKPPLPGAPPPAWIETLTTRTWLFYGSYCWKTQCADLIPPETRLPVFTVARGETVRVHLQFAATSATVSIDRHKLRTTFDAKKRILSWPAARAGVLTVFARATGDASYVARLRIR